MKKKVNILVITPFYDIFTKELIESTAEFLNHCDVFIHHNFLSELTKYLPCDGYFEHVRRFTKKNLLNLKNLPENVNVHLIDLLYFIPDGRNKEIGDKIVNKVLKEIFPRKDTFDIIHGHITWPCGYVAVKLGKILDIPSLITVHENKDLLMDKINSNNKNIFWAWKNANALIRVNKVDVPLLKKFNQNVYSLPNGFNPISLPVLERKHAREKLGLPVDSKIIFSLGFLSKRKGFQYLVNAMPELLDYNKDIFYFIGGMGPFKPNLEKRIEELNMSDHVKLIGFIPNDDLKYWFNSADLFLLPSSSEGNPTVMFEALGVGTPFVGTKIGGTSEIITSNDYGFLVEKENVNDLKDKMYIALEKKWNRQKIIEYSKKFTWKNIAEDTVNLYNQVIKNY
jgi:teichuronic acid biosynthesis glycosyltransferase TuaC